MTEPIEPGTEKAVPPQGYYAEGKEAEREHGIIYQGEFETPWDGTSAAVRLHARALAAQGVPLLLKSISHVVVNEHGAIEPVHIVGLPDEVRAEVGHLLLTSIRYGAPVIKHVVVRSAEHLRKLIVPNGAIPPTDDLEYIAKWRAAIYANVILYTVWERDRVEPEIIRQLGRAAEVWVPCEHNQAMLIAHGLSNVYVVPHPYDPADPICRLIERKPQTDQVVRFYSIGRWEPRKGFVEMIEAFLRAFKPGERVLLTIKYGGSGSWNDYPTPDQAITLGIAASSNGWTEETAHKHITLIDGKLKRSRIIELHFRNNIYVSASHGEGWALPAFEAKLSGNRMVHVPWGGTADFRGSNDVSVPYQKGPVHPSYGWERDAEWATYNVLDLAACLRFAAKEFWEEVPWAARFFRPVDMVGRFSMDAVGKLMLERVRHVLKGREDRIPYAVAR